jgi:putative SOS response-associated peptidase YedK
MCGRFVLTADPATIQTAFNLTTVPAQMTPRYNIAPTQPVAVITNERPQELTFHRWGLIPSWAKDMSIGAKTINARSETAYEKPSFKAAFKRRRCIIPADGYYEWTVEQGGKVPHFFHKQDRGVFGIAGLWESWHSSDGGEIRTCSLLTTSANAFTEPIHERMPVILSPADYHLWLSSKEEPLPLLQSLMKPYEGDDLAVYTVSRQVNKATIESPTLIEPLAG